MGATVSREQIAGLTETERARLRELVAEIGEVAAAAWIGCSRQTLARGIAGLDLHPGSIVLLRRGLSERVA